MARPQIRKKNADEIARLREAGAVLRTILDTLERLAAAGGMSTEELNDEALRLIEEHQASPILLGYHPDFASRPYPAAICTSINNVVQHGIPSARDILTEGDILNLDVSIEYAGMVVDSGRTFGIGAIDADAAKLIDVTREARTRAIAAAQPGNHIGDIGHAVETYVRPFGYGIVEVLCGHGVGFAVHEPPYVPNIGTPGRGELIEPGLVLAIEPIINEGSKEVIFDEEDGYSVYTVDGLRSAHFEHTVVVTEQGPEVVT